jgi:hypothetical protein
MLCHVIKTVHIDCGVQGDEQKDATHLFLPVFKAHFLKLDWSPSLEEAFGIFFTSKQAVKAFKKEILSLYPEKKFWEKCVLMGAVGEKTAKRMQQEFAHHVFLNCAKVFYPKTSNGLFALLLESNENIKNKLNIFIFTSVQGKSLEILHKIKLKKELSCKILPIYSLIDFNPKENLALLSLWFQKKEKKDSIYIFYCCSGYILKGTVNLLMIFFNVTRPVYLPLFIKFSVWEKSARAALLELNLIDREFS